MVREEELKRLALILCANPGIKAQELAQVAGISKATFYRNYRSKEALGVLLDAEAGKVIEEILGMTQEDGSCKSILHRVISHCCDHQEYLMFLCFGCMSGNYCEEKEKDFNNRMNAFFLRGQRSGEFRPDIPSDVMCELFLGMMGALFDGVRKGRTAPLRVAEYWEAAILDGIADRGGNV